MEVIDIEGLLKRNGIVEEISTGDPIGIVFSVIKKPTPNFVPFKKLPASKLRGVLTSS